MFGWFICCSLVSLSSRLATTKCVLRRARENEKKKEKKKKYSRARAQSCEATRAIEAKKAAAKENLSELRATLRLYAAQEEQLVDRCALLGK